MEVFDISVENRTMIGTSGVRKIKREGLVPGVLYQGNESIPILFKEVDIRHILDKNGNNVILNVNLNGKQIRAKVQEVQREPVNDEILHVDLMPLDNKVEYLH
ncbi:MAG: 50S ribosomal protein L25 [Bacillota bacterium]